MTFLYELRQESRLTIEALSKRSSTYKQGIKKNLPIGLRIGVIERAKVQLNIVKQLVIGKKASTIHKRGIAKKSLASRS